MTNKTKSGLSFLWLAVLAFIADMFTKYLIVTNFEYGESLNLLPIFNLTYVGNFGAAFSFLADHDGWQKFFFLGLALAISAMLIYFLMKNRHDQKLLNAAYALIIGGALGNAADRLYHGYVVDFLDFYWRDWHYPVFNVADIAICVGAGLIALDAFKNGNKQERK
ncbi:signal peptidase II [Aggregatibacter kilianii]|uniref:signal peptidase II n=1 Tax=Aggregatibacter kilianii TaxID=2025884 RepID=UPI000D649E0E|nr:signal peptidase II [Aggregatibacter kilianii]